MYVKKNAEKQVFLSLPRFVTWIVTKSCQGNSEYFFLDSVYYIKDKLYFLC